MRLQLMALLITVSSLHGLAQLDTSRSKKTLGPVDVDFLLGYYNQDGDHSAVTGGIGTQKLEDYATKIIVNIPLDSVNNLLYDFSFNYYSSASTDRIDRKVSSASSSDAHYQLEMEYSRKNLQKHFAFSINAGASLESDYVSSSVGLGWEKASADRNRTFAVHANAYFDHWRLIFPDELRDSAQQYVKTDKRRSVSLTLTYSQVLTRRLNAALTLEGVYQYGLLSTPFHRVYLRNVPEPKVETLPDYRIKFPIGLKMNYALGEHFILRFYYRFYIDDFGIRSQTASVEIPIKIAGAISVAPFYRFYHQPAAKYFRGFARHDLAEEFFTSDYDLSAFNSHKVGIGIYYYPENRVYHQIKRFRFKDAGVRYAHYFRSDGLKALMATTGISFSF